MKLIGTNGKGVEDCKVAAFDFVTREKVGEFESIGKAQRWLFIRSKSSIWKYLYGGINMTFKGKRRGIKSYKDDKVYHFEKI